VVIFMAKADLNRVPDGGVLRTLENGLLIIRRKKHEWSENLRSSARRSSRNGPARFGGSKFLDFRTLEALVDRIETAAILAGWTKEEQHPNPLDMIEPNEIGLVNGKKVRTIRFVCDGRHIHAYPIEDRHE
jgi:hypothetical protein